VATEQDKWTPGKGWNLDAFKQERERTPEEIALDALTGAGWVDESASPELIAEMEAFHRARAGALAPPHATPREAWEWYVTEYADGDSGFREREDALCADYIHERQAAAINAEAERLGAEAIDEFRAKFDACTTDAERVALVEQYDKPGGEQ